MLAGTEGENVAFARRIKCNVLIVRKAVLALDNGKNE